MSDTRRAAGLAWLTVDGVPYEVAGAPGYGVSSVTRETLTNMDFTFNYKEAPKAGFIKAQLRDTFNTSLAGFNAMVAVNVQLRLANGKTISGVNMWCVEAQEVDSTEATFDVRFEGEFVEEF